MVDLVTLDPNRAREAETVSTATKSERQDGELVEATGWIMNEKGCRCSRCIYIPKPGFDAIKKIAFLSIEIFPKGMQFPGDSNESSIQLTRPDRILPTKICSPDSQ
ncbi:hypothetical protein [Microseira sp. BLCC-F43]|jgi:hypothetical protein|uniref:hypothetical protein n=1 Tax=Microseira sp. BLCC-F43 TaxID=3153602 RepID=UPI0035B897EA